MSNVTLTFDDLNTGTVVDNEYQADGVTIFSIVNGVTNPVNNPAMVFDTDNPTGGDSDLATNNLGNVLIISEDGDSNDPDDNGSGGVLCFDFDDTVTMDKLTLLDVEEGARIKLWDANGNVIYSCKYYTDNNGQKVVDFNGIDGVARMDIVFSGSGAVDNISYATNGPDLDGTVEGSGGDDVIDVAYAGDPDGDKIDNNDAILAGDVADDDLVYAYGGDDVVKAGDGDDEVYGGHGADEIYTGAGNDVAFGGNGEDVLVGGSGDDELHGGSQDDVIIGDGADMTQGASEGKVLVWEDVASDGTNLGASTDYDAGGINVNIGFEAQDNWAMASISNSTVYTEAGEGFDSDSSLKLFGEGGEGGWDNTSQTTLMFSSTDASYENEVQNVAFRIDDVDLSTDHDDTHIDRLTILAYDADGNAVPVSITSETGDQIINGNTATGDIEHDAGVYPSTAEGSILINIAGPVAKIVIDYDNGGLTDQIVNVTDVTFDTIGTMGEQGVDGDDVLYGDDGNDIIEGRGGDDELYGGSGNDTLRGEDGNDTLDGGAGNDRLEGGDGDDSMTGGDSRDVILGGSGNDVADGGAGNDEIWMGSGDDVAEGGDGNDWMHGQTGADVLSGGAGDDMLFGEQGDDTLTGGDGDDLLEGGDDRDLIYGGAGDTVDGGAGGDDYDTLDLSGQGGFYLVGPDGTGEPVPDSNGNGLDGQVIFVDSNGNPTGETLVFTEIEEIIGDVVNRGPDAADDTATTDEDTPVTIDVLGNDSDPDGDDLTITDASVPADQGSVEIVGGQLVFTPAENFNGEATITYTITDGNGGEDTATVTVDVAPVNDGPDAVDDADTTDEDTPVTVDLLANDTDVDGDDLEVISATLISGEGEIVDNGDGTVTFTPAENFNGEAVIEYTISDGNGGEDTAQHTITVEAVDDAPEAADDVAETDEDTPVTIDVLENDSDPDGDPLEVTEATSPDGTVEINPDGTLTFTPDENFNGETTISYTVTDPDGNEDTATVTVTVNAVNDAPEANDDSDTTDYGTPVTVDLLANDTDVDGDDLTVVSATVPADEGTLVDNGDGTVTFTPALGFTGEASISYTIEDEEGLQDSAVHTITVGDAPLDGTVNGTDGDDVIDGSYLGDPEGDQVDNDDALIPGHNPDDDLIEAYGGNDTVDAGQGDDTVYGGTGDDMIDGGVGNDTMFGEDGNDKIEGSGGDDELYGGDGDDDLWGGANNDIVDGGAGNDTIGGGGGDDLIDGGDGDDVIDGGNNDDSITAGNGNDDVTGGSGDDVIDTSGDVTPLPDQAYPGIYGADDDPNNDLDTVYGGTGADTITTGDDDDEVYGGTGNDTIDVGVDDDYVEAGRGNDTVIGSEGNDEIYGNDGNDVIYGGLDESFPDVINIPDDGTGPFGADLVTDNNNDTLYGGAGKDTIFGADDADTLYGGADNDVLDGGVDDDTIFGDEGRDTIIGGQGEDELFGGLGNDVFLGGNGGDNVVGGEDPDLDGDGQSDDNDILDLTGSNVDFITYVDGDPEAGTVTFLDGSTMTFSEIENVIPCFTPGTTIATPKGERLVEELSEGDRIITRDNGIQEIRWLGRKEMSGKALVNNPHLKPVLIKAGALGNGLPERDMMVSPNHRVLVASDMTQLYFEEREVLAAAKHLVGSEGIHEIDVMTTSYIHFMFDRHEVVLSNGAWTESFQPGDYSLKGIGNSQRNEIFELFPELSTKPGLEGYQSARRALKKHEAKLLVK